MMGRPVYKNYATSFTSNPMFYFTLNPNRVIFFSLLALLTLYVVFTEFVFLGDKDSDLSHYKAMQWILIPHGLFGLTALILGPFQFSTTLRKKNIKLHKLIGKTYIIAILLAAPFAILLNIYYPIPGAKITFAFENFTQASVWAITALMAWIAAYRRQITIHKIWAARSYGLTLVFVLSRIKNPMELLIEKPDINDFAHFLWLLIVLALIIPDMLVFGKELFGRKKPRTVN
ncbi:hypothetical protein BH10BAC3_BH10BAC3_12340 [soil metagenome]